MSLIEEIIRDATNESVSLSSLLLKCQILVSRLGSEPGEAWVRWELNGYPEEVDVPPYRVLQLVPFAEVTDGFQVRRQPIPPANLGNDAERWTRFDYRKSIGSVASGLRDEEGTLQFYMNDFPHFLAKQFAKINPRWEVNDAWGQIAKSDFKTLLDAVRSRVLQFALDIQERDPDAGEGSSAGQPTVTVEQANNIFYTNVYGSAGVVGSAHHSQVTVNVLKGDFASLRQALETEGVSPEDIGELEQALVDEPELAGQNFGPKVSAWLAKMTGKAASGTWHIGIGAAGGFLAEVLSKFYFG